MAQIDVLAQQVALLTQAVNDIYANAKITGEFPQQSPLETDSLIRVEDSTGTSKYIAVLDILNKASYQLSNKLLYFNGVTIVGNTVTLLAGSVWRVDNVIYSNISNVVFSVPYVVSIGDVRKDIIIGGNSNSDVTKVVGSDGSSPIEPNYPLDKVLICYLIVSNSDIKLETSINENLTEQLDFEANGSDNFIDIGTSKTVKSFFYGSVLQEKSMWSQAGSIITFTFTPDAGAGTNNLQFI